MRKILAIALTVTVAAFSALKATATSSAPADASAATITTDKTDYQPGETVVVSGSGWAAGESVTLTFKEDPARHPDTTINAAADEYGNLVDKGFSPTAEHIGTTFTLTAVGESSGRTATATFTDGGAMNYSPNNHTLNIQSAASPQSASFSQTVSAPRGNGNFTASLLVTGTGLTPLPAAWVSASPNPLSYSTGSGTPTVFFPQTRTVTVTVPPLTPAGTYTAQVRVNPSISGVGQGPGTNLSVVVTADNAPPNTSLSATKADATAYNGVDWTNQDVTITLSAIDTGSPATGVASTQYKVDAGPYQTYTGPFTISSEGLHTVTYFSTDNSGNAEGGKTFTVKIDKTAPSPNCAIADGAWHADNVSVSCSPADGGGSGLASPGDITLTTSVAAGDEDANASTDSQAVCDNAGNCATAGPVNGNMVDRKAPAFDCDPAGSSWLGANAVIACTASDAGSGPAASSFSLSTSVPDGEEDANASTDTFEVCDAVGNCVTAGPVTGNMIDRKKPSVSCGNADGDWHASDVSIPCTASDAGSGLANAGDASFSLTTSVPANTEDANASTGDRNVCDAVGNCSAAGPVAGNMIDKKAPTLTASAAKADSSPYAAGGWTNQNVTVSFQCTDNGSGVATVDGPITFTTESASHSATGNCADNVGNAAPSATFSPVRIDKTAPVLAPARQAGSQANANGWNKTPVTVDANATDALSGLATVSPSASQTVSTEGLNQSVSFTATDNAGNSANASLGGINIDVTAPTVNISSPNAGPYLLNQPVAAGYTCSDGGNPPSGIDTCTGTVANGSNINTSSVGPKSFAVTATDKAGNSASSSVTYGVVYDWSGFLQPINNDGGSVFKLGSTVPVKFRLVGGSAGVVGANNFTLHAAKVSNNTTGTEYEAITSTPASTGNLFRYDPAGGIYIYNMGTKDPFWSAGTWQLRVDLGDGAPPRIVRISLKP